MSSITVAITTYILAVIVSFGVAGLIKLLTMAVHSFHKEEEK